MAALEENIKKADFRATLTTAIVAGLAFVVGLFWRDAIQATINRIIPQGDGLVFVYAAAIIATIVVIVIAYILVKLEQAQIRELFRNGRRRKEQEKAGKKPGKKA